LPLFRRRFSRRSSLCFRYFILTARLPRLRQSSSFPFLPVFSQSANFAASPLAPNPPISPNLSFIAPFPTVIFPALPFFSPTVADAVPSFYFRYFTLSAQILCFHQPSRPFPVDVPKRRRSARTP